MINWVNDNGIICNGRRECRGVKDSGTEGAKCYIDDRVRFDENRLEVNGNLHFDEKHMRTVEVSSNYDDTAFIRVGFTSKF